MLETDQLREDLEAWCASYVSAFESFDLSRISQHWAFPALIVSGKHQLSMATRDVFDRNTGALISFYEKHDARNVQRTIEWCRTFDKGKAIMQVADVMSTPSGEILTEWVSTYVLRKTSEGWRALFADATGEAAAWAARGTPLGS